MKEKSLLITLFDRGDEMQKLELKSYLEERDIYILNGKTNKVKEQNLEGTFNQIENIVLFHNRMGCYKENLLPSRAGHGGLAGRAHAGKHCCGGRQLLVHLGDEQPCVAAQRDAVHHAARHGRARLGPASADPPPLQ